ncbi:cobalt transporter CbiM [Rhodoferax sp. 4810]|uniref:Cobalt transporter CbiM n=1 Tax=Thiospirillum jenense TaxID=1653858 RepID=A0A839H5V3_9GAMM|nr:cobalt transporter CbiM [Thiospirillum jenense]MBB1076291.1 cobalt transporter CbiM [Rhodoferax jenense]MBB1124884.1 cobalt transporter CbiM [Thiospirillum jenense]
MAHLPDGILIAPLLITGGGVALGLLTYSIKHLTDEQLPQTAVLSAAFFVVSLINIPLGPSSVHLLLNGLIGVILGWAAVPALFIALLLQLVFFGHGGVTTLGINLLNMALPALICAGLFRLFIPRRPPLFWLGAVIGALGIIMTSAFVAGELILSGQAFLPTAQLLLITALPLAVIEAVVTGAALRFIHQIEPQLLPRTVLHQV